MLYIYALFEAGRTLLEFLQDYLYNLQSIVIEQKNFLRFFGTCRGSSHTRSVPPTLYSKSCQWSFMVFDDTTPDI